MFKRKSKTVIGILVMLDKIAFKCTTCHANTFEAVEGEYVGKDGKVNWAGQKVINDFIEKHTHGNEKPELRWVK